MSTKVSITFCIDEPSGTKAHLYEECLALDNDPIYLELTGVTDISLDVDEHAGTTVNVAIPRELARKLGLLAPKDD